MSSCVGIRTDAKKLDKVSQDAPTCIHSPFACILGYMDAIHWEEILDAGTGFWIFIAAIVVAGMWKDARQKAELHETLRRIVEKTGTVDEVKLKELFTEASEESTPGYGYRAARVTGTIAMFVGAAIATFFWIVAGFGKGSKASRVLTQRSSHPSAWPCGGLACGFWARWRCSWFWQYACAVGDRRIDPTFRT